MLQEFTDVADWQKDLLKLIALIFVSLAALVALLAVLLWYVCGQPFEADGPDCSCAVGQCQMPTGTTCVSLQPLIRHRR